MTNFQDNVLSDMLAVVCFLRMWNLEQNDNYVLSLDASGFEVGEVVNCISYSKVKGRIVTEPQHMSALDYYYDSYFTNCHCRK